MSFLDPSLKDRVNDESVGILISAYLETRAGLPPCNCNPNDQPCPGRGCIEVGVLTKLDRNSPLLSDEDRKKIDKSNRELNNHYKSIYEKGRDFRILLIDNPDNSSFRNDSQILDLFCKELSYLLS